MDRITGCVLRSTVLLLECEDVKIAQHGVLVDPGSGLLRRLAGYISRVEILDVECEGFWIDILERHDLVAVLAMHLAQNGLEAF